MVRFPINFCVRCDQKVLATRKHELWECPGNTLINHTHMKESEYLTSLAQEFWDADQVSFARGLLPRDWLLSSELAECNEVKMWQSVEFNACAKNHVVRLGRMRWKPENWSILLQLIDERNGVTDFIKVKSLLEDAGPSVIKQNKIACNHMLANSLTDVVAEEAAKRFLPDLNLERKAKRAERIGVGSAKRLALVQADIWAKRSVAGDIYEFDPLLVEEATCTRTVLSTLVDEMAHQGHLLERHNKGLRCKVCNAYRANRQFRFWSRLPCLPRPSAAVVISQFRNKKRQHTNKSADTRVTFLANLVNAAKRPANDEKELYHCTSLGCQDIQCTHSHPEFLPLLVSLEPEVDLAHTHQCCDYSISQAAQQSGESQNVLKKLHVCGMEGKRRKIASFVDLGGPSAPLRSNFDDPEGWDTSGSEEECAQRDVVHRTAPVAGRPIIKCGTSGCTGSCSLSVVENGYNAWKKPSTCGTCGKFFRARTSLESRVLSPHRSSVSSWSEALCEQSRSPVETVLPAAMAPVRPASRWRFLLVSLLRMNTPLFLVCLL